ncbi:hypothetical protein E2986_01354 [Frieseomelitta varia]|uniref:Uncharacterized protein n=2 Tax=Frieseomelitta varia TaxID=561572 RepID=A0A833RVL9_9HYME|nr:hypothetical protein E2986_01354 [Frieseomelitta varia]
MDALELQAALVKLDPATTVTPIGTNVKMLPPPHHHRIAFTVDLDENDLTLENAAQNDEREKTSNAAPRKLHNNCPAQVTVSGHPNHPNNRQIEVSKCEMAEVRGSKHHAKHHAKEKRHHHHHTMHHQHHRSHVVSQCVPIRA